VECLADPDYLTRMRQWTIDAFASGPFKGNQACVVEPFEVWPDDAWMQALAAENNQAETAFLLKTQHPDRFGLRWFTPKLEVPLCGHATLASAHVLYEELGLKADAVVFETNRAGHLIVYRKGPAFEMDFPADPPKKTEIPAGLAEALGKPPTEVWAGAYLVALYDDAASVRALSPNIAALEPIAGEATGGRGNICVAAPSDDGDYDVIDRFFAPGSGIAEDPATGSMHCILGPLFADKLGKAEVRFHQAYPGRGGDIETEMRGDRIRIRGRARTMMESRLRL
jgi:PhzF family phenazine biosynthesis protein